MNTKTVTINGKQVTLMYCYGTEINYSNLTNGNNAATFIAEAAAQLDALNKKTSMQVPNVEKCIKLVLAAALAYSMSKDEACPIEDKDLLFSSDPKELFEALAQVILLYGAFYNLLPEDQPKGKKGKQGKN